ncbi:MAG TPA: NAD(+) synthase [Thermotogota bacterium]|nr:NAD(+) synthase [Thermotogota bacterium]
MKNKCVELIWQTVDRFHFKGCLIGISGGIDSAVVAALCCEAVGKENVMGLLLPERDSSKRTLKDSRAVCEHLGISYKTKNISHIIRKTGAYSLKPPTRFIPKTIQEKYVKSKWQQLAHRDTFIEDLEGQGNQEFLDGLAFYRIKHRIRMCIFYLEAERRNFAVMGTTNKTELLTGFYVKWGDDSTDIEPIMHLYKTQVFDLARTLKLPDVIIDKAPSPDLLPGITDEFALKMSYIDLDRILLKMENGEMLEGERPDQINRVKEILMAAEKRKIKNINLLDGEDDRIHF